MEKYPVRMTYEELDSLRENDPEEFEGVTFGSKRDFVFGIWGLRCFTILLDRKFLIPLAREVRGFPFAVKGHERHGSLTVVDEDERVTFYLPEKELLPILHNAERMEADYTREGFSICRLPDVWFEDTHLVRFLRERVIAHPLYREWNRRIRHTMVGT